MLIWGCVFGILYHISVTIAEDPVPVILWGGSISTNTNDNGVKPHIVTDENHFSQILANKLDKIQPPILIFVKDNLCTPHIHQYKQVLEKLVDPNFLTYLPNVKKPMAVFENLPSYNHSTNEEINLLSNGEIAILPISDVEKIPEIYKSLENKSNLLVGLTGKKCHFKCVERVRRAIQDDDNSTDLQIITDRVILWSNQAPLIKYPDSNGFKPLQLPPADTSVRGSGTAKDPMILHVRFPPKDVLEFYFVSQSSSYWSLMNVVFMPDNTKKNYSTLSPIPNIVFPFNFSYHCAQKSVFSNADATLNISELQVQIDAKSFGEVYDCIGFTSIPIWTGVFVTFILGLIMIWGLIMIMDIRTMDRFDDPKGKTITISE